MGRKVHPYGFRLGVSRTWTAKWYADKEYTDLIKEDITIRKLVGARLANASVSGVEIERGINHVTVTIHTAKPGIVIGKGGANVEILRQQIGGLTKRRVKLEIKEIRQPELDAHLVAMNIAQQLTRRFVRPPICWRRISTFAPPLPMTIPGFAVWIVTVTWLMPRSISTSETLALASRCETSLRIDMSSRSRSV